MRFQNYFSVFCWFWRVRDYRTFPHFKRLTGQHNTVSINMLPFDLRFEHNCSSYFGFLFCGWLERWCVRAETRTLAYLRGRASGLTPPSPENGIKNTHKNFCIHDDTEDFTWFTLQSKSATETGRWLVHWNIVKLNTDLRICIKFSPFWLVLIFLVTSLDVASVILALFE